MKIDSFLDIKCNTVTHLRTQIVEGPFYFFFLGINEGLNKNQMNLHLLSYGILG